MASTLKSSLFIRGLPGETAAQLAARFSVALDDGEPVEDQLIAVMWAAFADDALESALGRTTLANEAAVLEALRTALGAAGAPVRITHTPYQWDFEALGTAVSF